MTTRRIESDDELPTIPDGDSSAMLGMMEPEDALLDSWVPIKKFDRVGARRYETIEAFAIAPRAETPAPDLVPQFDDEFIPRDDLAAAPDVASPRSPAPVDAWFERHLDALDLDEPTDRDHLRALAQPLQLLASEMARAAATGSVTWVAGEAGLTSFARVARRVLGRGAQPLPVKVLTTDEDGTLPADALPGDVLIAFGVRVGIDLGRLLEDAHDLGVLTALARPARAPAAVTIVDLPLDVTHAREIVRLDLAACQLLADLATAELEQRERARRRASA